MKLECENNPILLTLLLFSHALPHCLPPFGVCVCVFSIPSVPSSFSYRSISSIELALQLQSHFVCSQAHPLNLNLVQGILSWSLLPLHHIVDKFVLLFSLIVLYSSSNSLHLSSPVPQHQVLVVCSILSLSLSTRIYSTSHSSCVS